MLCGAVKTPFPPCFAPSVCEQIWLITDVNVTDMSSDRWLIPFPFPCRLCGCTSLSLTLSPPVFASHNPSLAPFICHFPSNISLWCAPRPSLVPQYLWRPVRWARGVRFFMWKRARSSSGGIHSQVSGYSCRAASLPQRPCPLPQSSALSSPTARLRGNVPRHLTSKQISYRESPWTRQPLC